MDIIGDVVTCCVVQNTSQPNRKPIFELQVLVEMGFTRVPIFVAFLAALISVLIFGVGRLFPRLDTPEHMLHQPAFAIPNLMSDEQFIALNDIIKEMKEFPSNIDADLKTGGFAPLHEHIGEAQQINDNGSCSHPMLVPNMNKTACILPQRIDIGSHFIMTGGPQAIREPFDVMISRLTSFGKYMFNVNDQYPIVNDLFNQKSFQDGAKSICPKDAQVLDPFQFNFIIQVPGQTVAMHIDGAYFWGATRKQFPQWLLACMVFSGLYHKEFIHQVQVVGYLHAWSPDGDSDSGSNTNSGSFVYYNDNTKENIILPYSKSGTLVDGSKVVHAAQIYKSSVQPPKLNKDDSSVLIYNNTTKGWDLYVNDNIIQSYQYDDLRISIVYRARCFKSVEDKELFYNFPSSRQMQLTTILSSLKQKIVLDNVIKREKMKKTYADYFYYHLFDRKYMKYGHYDTISSLNQLSTLDLSFLLMDYFITYPLPLHSVTIMPYNYCALIKLIPATKHVLQFVC